MRKSDYAARMKLAAPVLLLVLAAGAARGDTEQPLPLPFPAARYQQMRAKSPFAVATAAVATAAPTPGFAADLYVNGVARIGTSDFVTIKERGENKGTIFLQVGKANDDGLEAKSVLWAEEMGKTKVVVSKAGEQATLSFDQAEMAKAAPPAPMPGLPGVRLPMVPGGQRPGFPMPPGGRPGGFGLQQPGGRMPQNPGAADQSRMQFRRRALIPPAP